MSTSSPENGHCTASAPPLAAAEWRSLRRCLEAAGKGFAIGASLKGGLALLSILLRLRSRRARKAGALSNGETAVAALKETWRYGLFLGTFSGTFVSVDEIIAAVWGRKKTASWRALLAGLIAGPSMLLTGPTSRHTSLAVYILVRAAVLASRCGIESKRFESICRPLTWSYGDIFLMCLSSSQLLSAYFLNQESLPSSYKPFLNKHGGKDMEIVKGVRNLAFGIPVTNLDAIEKYYKSIGVDVRLDPNMKVACSMLHGNQPCVGHVFTFFWEAFWRALPVYIPVYLIPALISHQKDLLKRPHTILGKSLLGTGRSSLFLATFCTSPWVWSCLLFRILNRCNIPLVAVAAFLPGLALLIEKKSRRMEIALYCLARAIETSFAIISDAGLLPQALKLKRADVVLFSIATSIIMHCYSEEREVFRSKYLNVIEWVFGVPPVDEDEEKSKQS